MEAIAKISAIKKLPGKATPEKGTFNLLVDGQWYNLAPY
jgi:hypothetical protein